MIKESFSENKLASKSKGSSEYDINPLGYLRRARRQLFSKNPASIFYAALEIRFAIEARAREQLLSLGGIPKKIINMWHAEKIMHEMEKRINGTKQPFTFSIRYKNQEIRPFTYIPINRNILIEYGKLGSLLHVQKKRVSAEFIEDKKIWLNDLLRKMNETCRGHMLKPPKWKIMCSKCKQYISWDDIHKDSDLIICNCGHKGSLKEKEMTMSITARKKSRRSIELLQAERITGEI